MWQASGKSAQGRLLEHLEIAGDANRVMVVTGFRGTRNASTQLADSLARFVLERDGLTEHATLLIVRDANPDGRAHRTATNAHGVDIDRNFASSDWRKIPAGLQWIGGRQPASEPETQWIAGLVKTWRPSRIVVLLGDGRQAWIRTVGPETAWRDRMATRTNLPWVDSSLPLPSGSMASFAAIDLKIPTLLVNLPTDDNAVKFLESQQQLLTGVIEGPLQAPNTIARSERGGTPLQASFKPKRRLVDVLWPHLSKKTELAGGAMASPRVYRLPAAEHTVSRNAPRVPQQPLRDASERYPTLPRRPIPIWDAPRGL